MLTFTDGVLSFISRLLCFLRRKILYLIFKGLIVFPLFGFYRVVKGFLLLSLSFLNPLIISFFFKFMTNLVVKLCKQFWHSGKQWFCSFHQDVAFGVYIWVIIFLSILSHDFFVYVLMYVCYMYVFVWASALLCLCTYRDQSLFSIFFFIFFHITF